MLFGSYEWHLHHNLELSKRNAQVSMFNFRTTKIDFYLNHAIQHTCKSLKLKKQIKALMQ